MTVTDRGETRLAELEHWLHSLPAGVASWHREEVEGDPGGYTSPSSRSASLPPPRYGFGSIERRDSSTSGLERRTG